MPDKNQDYSRSEQPLNIGDTVYAQLKDRVTRGAYRPGDKLSIRSVAEALDVGLSPARDAVNRLVADGVLVYAGPKTVIIPVLKSADLREITLIRIALEGLAAEMAVQNSTQEDIVSLGEIQKKINSALEARAYSDALWYNKEFHFHVYGCSRLPHLISMIEPLWLRVGPSFYSLYPEFAEARHGVRNHEMVIEALGDRDGGALRAAIENDIRDGYRRLRQALKER
ncbi:GntR family transcriptional regulator [Rhizobium glycinendophyticum]|uniref:GntR family transcriptional regulator n=1 Tax=Rhizobium glycinendophyticum TaxID=2589807 RepID=A0A504TPF0_9HYPH|nr:GntR family transcriptional regulator [Rhizobium glycinendophyticum]TPP04588.1 GntR family transcriptional regulator [Rhizobium glycinendophyticum]